MIRPKELSDVELLDKYVSTQHSIKNIEHYLKEVSIGTLENAEMEIELSEYEDFLNQLAHEMMERLLERR